MRRKLLGMVLKDAFCGIHKFLTQSACTGDYSDITIANATMLWCYLWHCISHEILLFYKV